MLRGCQKRVIHLKDTKSHLFDEAYFIVREQNDTQEQIREKDMICEARRIIAQHLPPSERKRKARQRAFWLVGLSFLLGVLFSSLFVLLFL